MEPCNHAMAWLRSDHANWMTFARKVLAKTGGGDDNGVQYGPQQPKSSKAHR